MPLRELTFDPSAVADLARARGLRVPRTPPGGYARITRWALEGTGLLAVRLAADVVALSLFVVWASRHGDASAALLAFVPMAVAGLAVRGAYRSRLRPAVLDDLAPIAGAIAVAAMACIVLDSLLFGGDSTRALVRAWAFGTVGVLIAHTTLAIAQRGARIRGLTGTPTLIVGAGHVGAHVAHRLLAEPAYGLRPVGFLDADPVSDEDREVPVLGGPADVAEVIRVTGANHLVVAFSGAADSTLNSVVRDGRRLGLSVSIVPRLYETLDDRVQYEAIGGMPVLGLRSGHARHWRLLVKHALDRVAAAGLLLLFAPVLVAVALAVRLSVGRPILFRQRRVGRDGMPFDLVKFRTMRGPGSDDFVLIDGRAPGGVEGSDRRTRVGRFLRATSLDELPQLLNVLRGEMSLVGPRPERPEYVELFTDTVNRYAERQRVKAGMTGWAQVHGLRGQTSLADRVEWDNFYIEHLSLRLDLKILVMTLGALFKRVE
jgi:exopolysaccharide biosynthesis polyprenyl glycosylphosphotransferase